MRVVFVMDDLEMLHVEGDSTVAMMREATARGFEVSWCHPRALFVQDGTPWAMVEQVRVNMEAPYFERQGASTMDLRVADAIFMRKDPPFDMTYVMATYVLDLAREDVVMVNDPWGLKLFNEKLWAMHFAEFQPPTLLCNDAHRIRAFVEEQPHGAVLKPWDGNGGRGVVKTAAGDPNLPVLIELLTGEGKDFVIAQGFVPAVSKGDKRILLIDGEPVGAILRVPGEGDHRANMHVGASVEATTLSDADKAICDALAPHLRAHGQIFVGIDVIGGMLTEINVTSPTGFREVERLSGERLEARLLDCVVDKIQARQADSR